MSFWNIFDRMAVDNEGEVITKISDSISVSSDGTTYTRVGNSTIGSDGSFFSQTGNSSTDGSVRVGPTATGLGAVFNQSDDGFRT